MSALLKETYDKAENLKGKRLFTVLLVIFVVFTLIGVGLGNLINSKLPQDEATEIAQSNESKIEDIVGKVAYTNPELYPYTNDKDKISYVLLDSSGKELILLRAKDKKLAIVEGLTVKASGYVQKLEGTQRDVLIVEEVIINATN